MGKFLKRWILGFLAMVGITLMTASFLYIDERYPETKILGVWGIIVGLLMAGIFGSWSWLVEKKLKQF